MAKQHIYLNGRILLQEDAAISPLDIGLLRGYAVFDLLRTVNGRPFLLAEHLQRLRASAEKLGLAVSASDEEIAAVIDELLELNGHAEATVRLVLTGGVSPDGMAFDPATPTFFILTHELHEPPASLYESGGALLTERHKRELPEAKTTGYLTMLRNRDRTAEAGAMDLLYHDGENVFEAASASVYFVRDGRIHAPADCVLWGTVGSLVLEMAMDDYEVVVGDIALAEALTADEVFLTSTTRGVVPIVRLDDAPVGDGKPGPITRDLMARWNEALARA
ncbi:MAG: aminotransferase class IV [Coriobacteriia bacterium]|nr:aminotransferase class IV [Coriobacteriia bacterium]